MIQHFNATTALDVHSALAGRNMAGAKADIQRCFDSVDFGVAFLVFDHLGAPAGLAQVLRFFYAGQTRWFISRGCVHPSPVPVQRGLLQGCPASPALLNAIMAIWSLAMARAHPRIGLAIYLDDSGKEGHQPCERTALRISGPTGISACSAGVGTTTGTGTAAAQAREEAGISSAPKQNPAEMRIQGGAEGAEVISHRFLVGTNGISRFRVVVPEEAEVAHKTLGIPSKADGTMGQWVGWRVARKNAKWVRYSGCMVWGPNVTLAAHKADSMWEASGRGRSRGAGGGPILRHRWVSLVVRSVCPGLPARLKR